MSSTQDVSMDAEQMVSSEAKAAVAASNVDMEVENRVDGYEYDPNEEPEDYNEMYPDENYSDEDPVPALKKRTNGKEAVSP